MSSYKISEPSALKFLKANGAVVDENGNVVSDASDYWKKVYDQAEPKVAKYLHADGTIDENPGGGSGGGDVVLENNKEVTITENGTVEITPSVGKDAMKKVTATVNVSGGSGVMPFRFFDGRHSGYSANPKGFWVINAAQITGKACCLVITPGDNGQSDQRYCVQTIRSLTGNRLSIDEFDRESFEEVTAEVVAAAIAAL